MRNLRIGNTRRPCERLAQPRGSHHALDSERRAFCIIIHPTCRLNPSLMLIASIGLLLDSFHVFMVRYPFFFPNSLTLSFSAVGIPRPRYSRMTPVSS